jgi:hypothetical protein
MSVEARARAEAIVREFAIDNDLPPPRAFGGMRVRIFATQADMWRAYASNVSLPASTGLPRKQTVAMVLGEDILVVQESEFASILPNYAKLRKDAWIRLVSHELAHVWHIEIAKDGLGPRWFAEGLAVVAADQGFGEDRTVRSTDEALAPIDWQTDPSAYAAAAASVRFFAKRIPIRELIERASKPGLERWLRENR